MRAGGRLLPFLAATLLAACGGGGSADAPQPLETVDVSSAIDAGASLEGDVVAQPIEPPPGAIAGALPSDFPRDVPLPKPASLVDFATAPGFRSVTLESALSPQEARDAYEQRLRSAGFRPDPSGAWRRGDRTVAVAVDSFHGAARITIRVAVP